MPSGTLLYCRQGERGPGLAVRVPRTAVVSVIDGDAPTLVATGRGKKLVLDWFVFTDPGELGK